MPHHVRVADAGEGVVSEEDGVVGTCNGNQAREVLMILEQWEEQEASGQFVAALP